MKNKIPDNVIQFPVMERVRDIINEKIDSEIERFETEEIKAEVELKELEDEIEKLLNKESEEDDID